MVNSPRSKSPDTAAVGEAKGSRKNNFLFLGVETPVWQGARSAKDLSGTNLRASPVGVKLMDELNKDLSGTNLRASPVGVKPKEGLNNS